MATHNPMPNLPARSATGRPYLPQPLSFSLSKPYLSSSASMKNKLLSSRWAVFAALLALPQQAPAFEIPLSDIAVREAYFLGQRNDQKTADFLKLYTHSFPLPDKGPYVSEIHLLTPYAQVVANSSQHSAGYSAQQAAADYHGRGDTLLLQVRIEFTATYTYDDAVRTANDIAGELNRHLYPEDFWQAFRFTVSQNDQAFEPSEVRADPIYGSSSPVDASSTLRGTVVSMEFDANQFESQPAQAEVVTPAGQHVAAKFDFLKLH
jgi:hypothetical protein